MVSLTFGEQVKIVLSRKGMTIKELAETIQERTGNKMSRQNLTQRLGRDNFQEQDMRMIAEILGCPFQLSILGAEEADGTAEKSEPEHQQRLIVAGTGKHKKSEKADKAEAAERDITVGELVEMKEEIAREQEAADKKAERTVRYINTDALREARKSASKSGSVQEEPKRKPVTSVIKEYIKKPILKRVFEEEKAGEQPEETGSAEARETEPVSADTMPAEAVVTETTEAEKPVEAVEETKAADQEIAEDAVKETAEAPAAAPAEEVKEIQEEPAAVPVRPQEPAGDINPYTGKEYETNSVRMHPKRIGYVQVYDRNEHKWTDMTEWAFLGYQERKKAMLGKDYEPPIYLD